MTNLCVRACVRLLAWFFDLFMSYLIDFVVSYLGVVCVFWPRLIRSLSNRSRQCRHC